MEIVQKSVQNSTGDPARHSPEHGRGLVASTTDSALVYGSKPIYKMFYLYFGVAFFFCLPNLVHCVPASHEQSQNYVDVKGELSQSKYEQYYQDGVNIGRENAIQQASFIEKIQEKLLTSRHDNVRSKPLTLKAEISFGLHDMKNFLRRMVKGSSTTARQSPSHRSVRDTDPQMNAAESDGPWISNLSPAAVVGTIVGGTIGVFLIVVLTVIFCSYRNYSSLEMRQRTVDVYGGNEYPHQAERRM